MLIYYILTIYASPQVVAVVRALMVLCGQDIISVAPISTVDKSYVQSIRKSLSRILSRALQSNVSRDDNRPNRTRPRRRLARRRGSLVGLAQKKHRPLVARPALKSSNRKIADANRPHEQTAVAAFCSVNFGLYSRRLICHSIRLSWIGGHGAWGSGKS